MKRREFIAGLCVAAWPLAARAQQGERVRRIGVLMPENNPGAKARISAFTQTLEDFGWTDGRNVRINLRIDIPPLPSREKCQGAMASWRLRDRLVSGVWG